MHEAGIRTPSLQRHVERLDREVPVIDGTDGHPTTNREKRSRTPAR
jgi:hypothetical protein